MHIDELQERAQQGDQQAFAQIVETYQQVVAATALSHTRDLELARDISQEAFLLTWGKLHQVKKGRLRSYLLAVTRNLAHNARRLRKESPSPQEARDGVQLADEIMAGKQELALLQAALQSIPSSLRVPVVLYYQHGRSVADVAEALEISADAARQRISRGTRRLRQDLAPHFESLLQESRERDPRAFSAMVCAGLPVLKQPAKAGASLTGAGVSGLWKVFLGKQALAAIAIVFCSFAAALGVAGKIGTGDTGKGEDPLVVAGENGIADGESAAPTVNADVSPGPGLPSHNDSPEDTGWQPNWSEQPLVTGLLLLNKPELDLDKDGTISDDEIRSQQESQAETMAKLLLDARQRLRAGAGKRPLTRHVHETLLRALERDGILVDEVLTKGIRIVVPRYQDLAFGPTRQNDRWYGNDETKVIVRDSGQPPQPGELLAQLDAGTHVAALRGTLQWEISTELRDTLQVVCQRVFFSRDGLGQDMMAVLVKDVSPILRGATQHGSDLENLSEQLEEMLALKIPSICVDLEVRRGGFLSDHEVVIAVNEAWDTLGALVVEEVSLQSETTSDRARP